MKILSITLHALKRLFAPAALALALAGCSPARMLNALVPESGFAREVGQAYGPDARQTLDIYRPKIMTGPRPVVVFFHGGNWESGSKDDYLFVGEALAAQGFVVVIPNYRLYPQIRFPTFLEDCAATVAWTREHIAAAGGNPADIHLMGHSAGAHIAAMLALDGRWLGPGRAAVRSVVGLAGPYDFLPLTDPVLQAIFAPAGDLTLTQPITFVDATAPAFFLASGTADSTVKPGNSARLAARIRAAGGQAEEYYYADRGHVAVVAALARPLRFLAPVLDDVTAFLAANSADNGQNRS